MCIYNVRIDDAVLERVKPHFKGTDAMQLWIEQQLQKALFDYASQFEENKIKEEKKKAFMERMKTIENDPDGFFKLGGFMADSKSSAEELLEEALFDKYGI
jgi:hypothetical protein